MRTVRLCLMLCLLAVVVCGATAAAAPLGATYEDPQGFFSIEYPAGWTTHDSGKGIYFWADEKGNAALGVSIVTEVRSATELADALSQVMVEKAADYKELLREEKSLSGLPAIWLQQSYTSGKVPIRALAVAVVRNRVGYLIRTWASPEEHAKLEPLFRASAESLRIPDFPEAPLYDRWLSYRSEHLTCYYLPDTYLADNMKAIAAMHEEAFADVVKALGVEYSGPVALYFYPSREALYWATALDSGFAIAEASEAHIWWLSAQEHQSPGHELTHVITTQALGQPAEALVGEGVAVCQDHSGRDHDATTVELRAKGQFVPVTKLLGNAWFTDRAVSEPESGSFVCYLLDKYGAERFRQLFAEPDLKAAVKTLYGKDLGALEKEWLAGLE